MILMIQMLLLIQMINHLWFQRLRVMGISSRVTHLSKSTIKTVEVVSLLLFLEKCLHYGDNQGVARVTFNCSKLSIEIMENSAKYFTNLQQSLQQKHQNEVYDVVLEFLLLTEHMSHLFLPFRLVVTLSK